MQEIGGVPLAKASHEDILPTCFLRDMKVSYGWRRGWDLMVHCIRRTRDPLEPHRTPSAALEHISIEVLIRS